MRRLLLLRHAKSSWANAGVADRDRTLTERGESAAATMGKAMAERGLIPDRILCSTARRTRETLAALQPHLAAEAPVVLLEELYSTPDEDYTAILATNGGDARNLLVIGHNPRTQVTAVNLVRDGDKAERARLAGKFPTAALAVIGFDRDGWETLASDRGRLELFLTPRDLGGDDD
jgi:phosphohistidine phosphatase